MINKRNRSLQLAFPAILAIFLLACAGNSTEGVTTDADIQPAAQEAAQQQDQDPAEVSCEMTFTMEGWSAIISKAEGEGTITCDNGQTAEVELAVIGGGLTVGKTKIDEGSGTFSDVTDIEEIFGAYAQAEAQAGAVESASAQALTKGEVSLVITAEGRGWSLGVSGAKFEISRAVS